MSIDEDRLNDKFDYYLKRCSNNPDDPKAFEELGAAVLAYSVACIPEDKNNIFWISNVSTADTILFTAIYMYYAILMITPDNNESRRAFSDGFLNIIEFGLKITIYVLEEDEKKRMFSDRFLYYSELLRNINDEAGAINTFSEAFKNILQMDKAYSYKNYLGFPKCSELEEYVYLFPATQMIKDNIDIDAYIHSFPSAFGDSIRSVINDINCNKYKEKIKVVWKNSNGIITCPGDDCPKECDYSCPIFLNTEAITALSNNYTEKAKDLFEKAISIEPDFYDVWNNLAAVYGKEGDYSKALSCYEKAHSLNPNKPNPIFGMAMANRDLGRYTESLKCCDEYDKIASDHKCDSVREYCEKKIQNGKQDKEDNEQKNYLDILKVLLKAGAEQNYLSDGSKFNHIPEIMVQMNQVCKSITEAVYKEAEEDDNPFMASLNFCCFGGMGAVYHWNENWDKLKKKGIFNTLTEERGIYYMDEYVINAIGVGYDTPESKNLYHHINEQSTLARACAMMSGIENSFIEECRAMYLYGMVLEMHRLGMG